MKEQEQKKREVKEKSKDKRKEKKLPSTVTLGEESDQEMEEKTEKKPQILISDISDIKLLEKMKEDSISRGKKQRIKKRLAQLMGKEYKVEKTEPKQKKMTDVKALVEKAKAPK